MGIYYLSLGLYWRNLTSPLTYRHRGTAFQLDTMKDHPEMQVLHTALGTDVVLFTMAARIIQAIVSLVRNRLHRAWCWKLLPGAWLSKAFRAVLWMCRSVIEILLALEMTRVYFNMNQPKPKRLCHTEQTMSTISIKCHWGCHTELVKERIVPEEEELPNSKMGTLQDDTNMDLDSDSRLLFNMDKMARKEILLPSCTKPAILSMIHVPSEDGGSSLPSEESDLSDQSDVEDGDEWLEKGSSLEDVSVDSGMQESWTPKSKEDKGSDEKGDWSEDDCGEKSDWSDDDDCDEKSDWSDEDEESHTGYNKENEDLWASFCQNDDPYNPLSFVMPTGSPKQQTEQLSTEVPTASLEKHPVSGNPDCANSWAIFKACKTPILTSFKSSHQCTLKEGELECLQEAKEQGTPPIKKVRFSSTVTVHPMITWSYAHRMARKGPWEEYARDHSRFQRRIADTEAAIGFCLEPGHRELIWAGLQRKKN